MFVYGLELSIVLLMGLVFSKSCRLTADAKRKLYLFIVFSVLFFFSAFRSVTVGTDTYQYAYGVLRRSNQNITIDLLMEQKAPLYSLLVMIGSRFLPPLQTYQIISSIIIEGSFAFFIYKCSKGCFLSTWLFMVQYFYFHSLNTGRQFMAMGFVAIAVYFIFKKRKNTAIVFILLATLIHIAALVTFPILFFDNRKKEVRILLIVGVCLAITLYPVLLRLFVSIFPKYAFYYIRGMFNQTGRNRKVYLTIFQLLFLLYSFYVYKKNISVLEDDERTEFQIVLYMATIGVFLGFAALKSILITRIEYFYSFSFLLLVPLTQRYSGVNRGIIGPAVAFIMTIPGIILLIGGTGGILPYSFFAE